ncbi:MAG: hypothetical protein QOD86_1811 [Miltoncostaeaceae bacterium]|jgi:SAM-dependent methyltransferase|nr:hypothetical protein [Miltoncostaeaceae bacterium]
MMTTAAPALDQARADAFLSTVLEHTSATTTTVLAAIGDRLGLFADLAEHGPATPAELAGRAAIDPRYAREWLSALASAGYLEYAPEDGRYALPPEHVAVLAEERGPHFFGGVHQMLVGMVKPIDLLVEAFRSGGGVPQSAYDEDIWAGMDRFTASWFDHLLLQAWIPGMPRVRALLEAGAEVADVGCGRGRALIRLAQAFPRSRFVGFDVFAPSVERARAFAAEAGVADRVRFEVHDGAAGLPGRYDVITTFDVVHDAVDPRGLLRAIRRAVREDGVYVCLDVNCSHRVEENAGPLGSLLYGFSILYCMTTSLAGAGEGLGTCGFSETVVRDLCAAAGFRGVRLVPLENPFNNLYEITP